VRIIHRYANEIPAPSDPVCTQGGGSGGKPLGKLRSRGALSALTKSKLPAAIDGNVFYNAPAAEQGGSAAGNKAPEQEPSFFQKYKWCVSCVLYVACVWSVGR
jgi:hypothetical protein